MGCCTMFIPKIEIKKNHVFLHEYNQSRLYCQLNVCDHNFPLEVKIINDFYYMPIIISFCNENVDAFARGYFY